MIAGDPAMKRAAEREALRAVIQQWNANRLDLFELSEPNEDLEFHGVMRFYFHDSGQRVATKCIRVASDATVTAVIETLIEKFRPDMRMLSVPEYALYVTHENRDERRLNPDEKPLLVQLNWHKDDREGRFLLKRIDDKTKVSMREMPSNSFQESSFRRKLSKREKKQLKKQEKLKRMKSNGDAGEGSVAEKLYTELPETSFTRSISNPEAVMRRRRQQKLEKKLQQFRSKDGGPDTGGTLKIYGEALCGDVPYKTLLLSVGDTTTHVVKEMLSKYGMDKEDAHNYCLVQVNTGDPLGPTEYILDEDECPLAILMNHPSTSGSIMFHVRRRPADYHPRKRKKKPQQKWQRGDLEYRYDDDLPFFLELNPDGSEIMSGTAKRHILHPNVTEVGSERTGGPNLQLFGPNIQPRHCVIAHTDGLVTVTPCSRDAETYVNGQRIYETTILQNGAVVKFGRIHNFRFMDPSGEDRGRARQAEFAYDRLSKDDNNSTTTAHNSNNMSNYETTFDVDGNVETVSLKDMDSRSQRSIASSRDGNRLSNYERYPRGNDPILPAVLELREETEEPFLHAVIIDLDPTVPSFKLAPTYTLYLTARYRASTHYRPELSPTERAHRLTVMLARVASMIQHVIQERYSDTKSLAFWMANASELLHFLKCDRHVSAFSLDAQDILAECVQLAFRNLVSCHQGELTSAMSHFLSDRDDSPNTVLQVLSSAMALLRRCRVNAALTIQLFSQLFHFVNMMAFNKIVTSPSQPQGLNYCSRAWGVRLKDRVAQLGVWAERQGLELAANCHLGRLAEAAYLLEAPKYNANDLAQLSSTCLKLNSLQLRALLRGYQPQHDEPKLPLELIDNVVHVAENVADELARSDGREVKLEEDVELQLPFLLPEDGYSCDVVRGVPQGLTEFLQPLQSAGLCRMNVQPTSSGQWTIYMAEPNTNLRSPSAMSNRIPSTQQTLEIQTIRLHKSNNGMGLSIVAAKGAGQDRLGIYIKSVVAGGAADVDGRLQAGDQLLKVDGQSLVGITQEKAAEYLVRTGPVVTLEVAKQGAIYHGLATLLSQPSPLMSRANNGQGRRNSEHFERRPPAAMPSSVSMMNLQTRQGELSGLAKGCTYDPIPCNRIILPNDPFIDPPRRILHCDMEDALAVRTRRDFNPYDSDLPNVPRIVINVIDEDDNSSTFSNDSDNPDKSKIFSTIQKVKFLKTEEEVRQEGTHLTKEETERCIQELKNIVADFEKCTLDSKTLAKTEPEPEVNPRESELRTSMLNLDLSGVNSDSEDDSDSLIYEYRPLTTSLSDLRKTHDHTSLIRKDFRGKYKSLETIPQSSLESGKKYKSLDFVPGLSVKELTKTFEKCERSFPRSPKKFFCEHNKLKIVTKHKSSKSIEKVIKRNGDVKMKEIGSPSRIRIGDGRVAALTKHFSRMGDAGLIKFYESPSQMKGSSDPVLHSLVREIYVTSDAETQTSVRSTPNLTTAEAEVQTHEQVNNLNVVPSKVEKLPAKARNITKPDPESKYNYDYSLIYSLGLKKVGFSLDNLLGFPVDRLKLPKKLKKPPPEKRKEDDEKPKKFPKDYIRRRKPKGDDNGFLSAKWFSEEVLSPRVGGEPSTSQGGGCPRRMSERDLPSRLHGEDPKKQLPPHVPIQSSKSVPSLHTGTQNPEPRQQEVFNPGYSRTSSTNSIPQSALRSRSNQNLSGTPGAGQGSSLHPTQSTPSLHQPQHFPGQPGYSNQSMYNSNNSGYQHDSSAQSSGYQGPVSTPMSSPYQGTPGSSNYTPANSNYPGTPQSNQYPGTPANSQYQGTPNSSHYPGTPGSNQYQGTPGSSQYQGTPGSNQYQGTPNSNQYPGTPANSMYTGTPGSSQFQGTPGSNQYPGASQNNSFQGTPGSYHYQGTSSAPGGYHYHGTPANYSQQMENERFYQNLCVYRSPDGYNRNKMTSPEERNGNNPPPLNRSSGSEIPRDRPASAYIPPHSMPLQNTGMQMRSQSSRDMFRQEAKLQEMTEEVRRRELRGAPMSRPGVSFGPPPVAPKPLLSDEYRESPPPPPPPANTHPLLQKATSPDNRYQASLGEPPRGGYYPTSPADRRQYPYTGTNPWEREEKEKEQARRREAARQWREQQINELNNITSRTPQQEEQLRALKLEREFERRAEEAKQEDEEEGEEESAVAESSERVQGLLRMAQQQNGPIIRPATGSIAQMKLEEVRRQHAQGQNLNLKVSPTKATNVNDLRFENLSINGPSQYNGYYHEKSNGNIPQPPERVSSYQIMSQSSGGVLKSPVNAPSQPTKRVSFSDPNSNSTVSNNNNNNNNNNSNLPMEKIMEDPNNFINEAETMLNSPKTPDGTPSFTGNTPGVIGAQEVYRDPRQRLLAEQKQNSAPKVPGPEKLSFKEKMKMFAMETGEDGTPRDKVKISRAQRDIDNISSPLNNN